MKFDGSPFDLDRVAAFNSVESGDFQGALPFYEEQVATEPTMPSWNELGKVYTCLGRYGDAEAAYRVPRTLPHPYGYVTDRVGGSLWLRNRKVEAYQDWIAELETLMSGRLKRYDASGPYLCALIWWASRYLQAPGIWTAMSKLVKQVQKTRGQQEEWGMALLGLSLCRVPPNVLLDLAVDGRSDDVSAHQWKIQQLCQAHFFIAGLDERGSPGWTDHLSEAVRIGTPAAYGFTEYHIAAHELGRSVGPAGGDA